MNKFIHEQIQAVLDSYPNLRLVQNGSDILLTGSLYFSALAEGKETITANYDVKISVPCSYPDDLPTVFPSVYSLDKRFEHTNPDGSFCLAIPIEERELFEIEPSLLGFINNLVVPFLYGYSYFLKYGEHPFDEREHGNKGILDFYLERFKSRDARTVLTSLYKFAVHGYHAHEKCPCGSGKKVLKCHNTELKSLLKNKELLIADLAKFITR
ncbi:SEC-C domain-containing protein [Pseudoalteromonas sp. 2CM39R]|uniref:SEC-C domain-containing protein n=1 Tax=Pseudoalteromonas sp. 2CM39R TaxID=2929856 RepID=UPI0020BEF07D|nr:SEC-C domain-containing protein [Pseudoalteromonas sp. 2CM39R]MCK8123918.1 SEC-C domain-containing protein [Pseudoalteromonas sp. 2CM39R]